MLAALAVVMAVLALQVDHLPVLITGIVVGGLFLGVMNTVLTESVMEATDLPRAVASSTYSGVRFVGGAAAPALAGVIATALGYGAPYWVGCAGLVIAAGIIAVGRRHLARIDTHRQEEPATEALALTAADA
jgi:predicted MFS family arabinose efflux permease